jgi:hypothetical protein
MSAWPWLLLFPAADVISSVTIGHCSNRLFMLIATVQTGHILQCYFVVVIGKTSVLLSILKH